MADIELQFPIARDAQSVFAAMATSAGLNAWWTLDCTGAPTVGVWYAFDFGLGERWAGVVSKCDAPYAFEWTMGASDADWRGTRVGFTLHDTAEGVRVEFYHRGWATANAHFRVSAYCWAMYCRILRRWVERGEVVPYAERDGA